jgi:hypothetical protein
MSIKAFSYIYKMYFNIYIYIYIYIYILLIRYRMNYHLIQRHEIIRFKEKEKEK